MTDVPAELAALQARVSAVESRLDQEASLRAMVDTDLSTVSIRLNAQHRMLIALAETQRDHTRMLREHSDLLREHSELLRDHGQRLGRLEAGLGRVEVGVHAILGLLGGGDDDGSAEG